MAFFKKLFAESKRIETVHKPKLMTIKSESFDATDIISPYDFNLLKERKEGGHYYLLEYTNENVAIDVIPDIDSILKSAKKICKEVVYHRIDKSLFEPTIYKDKYQEYYKLQLSFSPLTNAGKISKYPYVVHYFPNDRVFGDVYYGKDGKIGKMRLIEWKENTHCYEIDVVNSNEQLTIKSIYKKSSSDSKKVKIYQN